MLIRMALPGILDALTCRRAAAAAGTEAVAAWRPGAPGRDEGRPLPHLSWSGLLLVPLAVFAIAVPAIEFSHSSKYIATLWPANAILLTALLRLARSARSDGVLLLGGAIAIGLANIAGGNGLLPSMVLGVANVAEAATALALLSLLRIDARNLTRFRNLLLFMVVAGSIAPAVSATLGGLELKATRGLAFAAVWRNWYLANALGMIIVVPFLVSVTPAEWGRSGRRRLEAVSLLALVVAVAVCGAYFRSILFIVVPAILFATVRFGMIGATAATLVTTLIVGGFVVFGIGEPLLARPELSERILGLQVLLAVTALWSLPTAALLAERDALLHDVSLVNTRLRADSDVKSDLVVGLRRRLSIAEEQERLRLSHELHDQAGQGVVAAILELNEIEPLVHGPARNRLHLMRKTMEQLGKTLHRIAWELRPPSIDELGLRKAMASYIAEWGDQCGTAVDFHCDDPDFDAVPGEIATAVYRLVQEGLTNVVKHARQPSDVSVVIRRVGPVLQVIIEDNGCGFDPAALAGKAGGSRGLGLDGMRERLSLVGGTLEIESAAGTGTTIFARIALDAARSAA
jgi:signal transduction histidine kinase